MTNATEPGRGPHRPPAPLTTDELLDAFILAVRAGLPPAEIRSRVDYHTLTHTPQGAADPGFRAHTTAIAVALAAAIVPDPGDTPLVVEFDFSGVPVSGSVHCRATVSGGRIDQTTLRAAICEHGAATLSDAAEHCIAFAIYPPAAAAEPDFPL